jgi:hypothetical protein
MNTCKVLLLFALSVASATVSAAEYSSSYPGAMCQPVGNNQPIRNNGRGGYGLNASAVQQTWICPVVSSAFVCSAEFCTRHIRYAEVVVGSDAITCQLFSRTSAGTLIDVNAPDRTDFREHLYAHVFERNLDGRLAGFYHFRCEVPPGVGVISYRVEEEWTQAN